MPITDVNVVDGPNVQPNGEYRGTVELIFDDGRVVTRNLRQPDANAWANLLADISEQVQREIEAADAEEAVDADLEVQDYKQATKKQLALAYLRRAWAQEEPYTAYLQFSRFNEWRVSEGYTLAQVQQALESVGLSVEDWDRMRAAYVWLSNAGRVTAMQAYQDVADGWPEYRG